MKVIVTTTGTVGRPNIEWPEGWPIPHVDDEVDIPGFGETTHVRVVEWHPLGDVEKLDDVGLDEPYVYIVLGPRRGGNW